MIKINVIPDAIGPFTRHVATPTTMVYGFYYETKVELPFAKGKRMVRVWLPPTYDFYEPKKYPVMYMADGQNLVDKYLTRYGDWHLDRVVYDLMREGYPEPILVGIDCPYDPLQRMNELNPPYPIKKKWIKVEGPDHPIGDQFLDYVVKELKPLIDATFSTDSRKEATGIGGASMGGIMAFYAFLSHPETFGYSHAFSCPFFFYSKRSLRKILQDFEPNPRTHGRVYLYVGGKGFERTFVKNTLYMRKLLKKRGFDESMLGFSMDKAAIHQEEWWSKYSYPALRFWLGELT